jgi:molybdopterin/thiamine biosynthesis adenylyltransferase
MYENAQVAHYKMVVSCPKNFSIKLIQDFSFELKYKLCDCDCIKRMVQKFMTISFIAFLTQDFKLGMRLKSMIVIVSKERCVTKIFKKRSSS